jgi:hypothetical protein
MEKVKNILHSTTAKAEKPIKLYSHAGVCMLPFDDQMAARLSFNDLRLMPLTVDPRFCTRY